VNPVLSILSSGYSLAAQEVKSSGLEVTFFVWNVYAGRVVFSAPPAARFERTKAIPQRLLY